MTNTTHQHRKNIQEHDEIQRMNLVLKLHIFQDVNNFDVFRITNQWNLPKQRRTQPTTMCLTGAKSKISS